MATVPFLSVVLACYNEEAILAALTAALRDFDIETRTLASGATQLVGEEADGTGARASHPDKESPR